MLGLVEMDQHCLSIVPPCQGAGSGQGAGRGTQPGRLAQINQTDIPFHMTSAQILKLREEGRMGSIFYLQCLPSEKTVPCAEALLPG